MLTDGSLPDIANAGPLPLAVSVDEEGGRVSRLSSLIGSAPSARVLAQTQTPDEVYQLALDRGRKMRDLGITIDFAPVVDVTDAPDDTVIGDRSFSNDPAGHRTTPAPTPAVCATPGCCRCSSTSPATATARVIRTPGGVATPPLSDCRTRPGALPHAVTAGARRGDDRPPRGARPDRRDPASLSPAAVSLLRSGGYGGPPFNGPVFTDDLSSMAAITDRYGVAEAVLRALQAGADVALWVTTDEVPAVLDRLEKAVNAGELTMPARRRIGAADGGLQGPQPACGR